MATAKFEQLSEEKTKLESAMFLLEQKEDQEIVVKESIVGIQEALADYKKGFDKANGALKRRLLRKLLRQVVLTPEGLHIFMHLANGVHIPNHLIQLVKFEGAKKALDRFAIGRGVSGSFPKLLVLRSDINTDGDLRLQIRNVGRAP